MKIISKIILGLRSVILSFHFYLVNIISKHKLEPRNIDVIVSLTCFPGRINKVYITIESIMAQKYPNFSVVLYLSKDEFPGGINSLPQELKRLHSRGLIIEFVQKNIRSFKKLHYALKDYPHIPIITADDDVIYPPGWINNFMQHHTMSPRDVLFARGHEITFCPKTNKVNPYSLFTPPVGFSSSLLYIPTGVSGVLYPVGCFYKDVFREDIFMNITPNADDIWYKIMTYMNGRKCKLIYADNIHFVPVMGTQKISLRKTNLSDDGLNNDLQLNKVMSFYSINFLNNIDE